MAERTRLQRVLARHGGAEARTSIAGGIRDALAQLEARKPERAAANGTIASATLDTRKPTGLCLTSSTRASIATRWRPLCCHPAPASGLSQGVASTDRPGPTSRLHLVLLRHDHRLLLLISEFLKPTASAPLIAAVPHTIAHPSGD